MFIVWNRLPWGTPLEEKDSSKRAFYKDTNLQNNFINFNTRKPRASFEMSGHHLQSQKLQYHTANWRLILPTQRPASG